MNARKSIAVIAAMLITTAGMAGIATYSNAAADASRAVINATATTVITTLPTIEVTPSSAQLRELHKQGQKGNAASPSSARADAAMPYYSFASSEAGA
jgi:Flp pilus assembly protein CpaB